MMDRREPDTRQEIERAISTQGLTRQNLARAPLSLARVARHHERVVAARHGFDSPAELERAVLDGVHRELALLNLGVEPDGA